MNGDENDRNDGDGDENDGDGDENDRNDGGGDENDGGADHDSVKGEQRQLSLTWLPSGRPPFPYWTPLTQCCPVRCIPDTTGKDISYIVSYMYDASTVVAPLCDS